MMSEEKGIALKEKTAGAMAQYAQQGTDDFQGVDLASSEIDHKELLDVIDNGVRLPVNDVPEYWTLPDDPMDKPIQVQVKNIGIIHIPETKDDGSEVFNEETGEVVMKETPCVLFYELIKKEDGTIFFQLCKSYAFFLHKSFLELIRTNGFGRDQVYDLTFNGRRRTKNGNLAAKFLIAPIYNLKEVVV